MKVDFQYPEGATSLDPDEIKGLIPSYISTQGELNAAEQANILEAEVWTFGRKQEDFLSFDFIKGLHKRMFKDVWKWAGQFRTSNKNIGVDWPKISEELVKLCGDTEYWIKNKTYPPDELGARFHHRLISIHPFPNGNGRHARLMTDILMGHLNEKKFSWGAKAENDSIVRDGEVRDNYLIALRAADNKNIDPLVKFVRS
jgi:Fic-DOC domain mobile mystery protein B